MEELFKNPLLGHIKNRGFEVDSPFFVADSSSDNILNGPNPLAITLDGADINNSPFAEQKPLNDSPKTDPIKPDKQEDTVTFTKKRLNDLDFNILQNSAVKKAQEDFKGNNIIGKILYKYFPKIYKSIIVRKGLRKLVALNQTAKELVSMKSVPYGESDKRYSALIEYLSSANAIHSGLVKKI